MLSLLASISQGKSIQEKLEPIHKLLKEKSSVERLTVYNVDHNQNLQVQAIYSYEDQNDLVYYSTFNPKFSSILLQETMFGQIFATLKPQFITALDENTDIDIPQYIKEKIQKSQDIDDKIKNHSWQKHIKKVWLLPLIENKKIIAILCFASSSQNGNWEFIEYLKDLGPVLALSLQQENYNLNIAQNRKLIENTNKVYTLLNQYLLSIFPSMDKQKFYSQFFLRKKETEKIKNSFSLEEWITLFKDISRNLVLEKAIDKDSEEKLKEKLKDGYYNLYWICAEAIQNIIEHSHAKQAKISLVNSKRMDIIELSILDDGDGLLRTVGSESIEEIPKIHSLAIASNGQMSVKKGLSGYGLGIHISWNLS